MFWGGDANVFAYAGNDPVNRIDPMGLDDSWPGSWNIPGKLRAFVAGGPTPMGLAVGMAAWVAGGNAPRLGNNAVEFTGNPFVGAFTPAVTFGNVICYESAVPDVMTDHERQHTYQAEVLGPAYLPLHAGSQVAGFVSSLFDTSRTYADLNARVHGPWNLMETGPSVDGAERPWWWEWP